MDHYIFVVPLGVGVITSVILSSIFLMWGAFVMSTFVVGQGVRTIDDILLSAWTSDSDDSTLLLYYAVFALLTFVCFVFSSVIFMWSAVRASRVFHARIFDAILCAPVNNFFDVTKVALFLIYSRKISTTSTCFFHTIRSNSFKIPCTLSLPACCALPPTRSLPWFFLCCWLSF